jgi:SdpC family antimicrobial peptide
MHRRSGAKIVAAIVALSVAAMGGAIGSQPDRDVSAIARQDGETAFRGIFIGTGPAAGIVPNAAGIPGHVAPAIAEVEAEILDHIRTSAPRFMGWFGNAVRSGDPAIVARAVERGATLFRLAVADELGLREPGVAEAIRNLPSDRYRVGAVAVAIVVALWLWIWAWTADVPKPGDLTWEMLIRDITVEFAAG